MGYGSYSYEAHRAITTQRKGKSAQEVFNQRTIHPLMDPHGVKARESRDSDDHPESLGVAFALDVSGSMGTIPELIARQELPGFMKLLMDCGVTSPQVLFMAFTDHGTDAKPLQVGQFETTAELMDQWLTRSWLVGGGRTAYESYELAFHFAARHTAMDCWEKRQHKGYLFVTGDEPGYDALSAKVAKDVLGTDLGDDLPVADVIAEALQSFEGFFLVPDPGRLKGIEAYWKPLLGDRLIGMADPIDTCPVAAGLVALGEGAVKDVDELGERLLAVGKDAARVEAVKQALRPWAER